MHNPTTIASQAPDPADCERIGNLFMAGNMQAWFDAYAALRGPFWAAIALGAEIREVKRMIANCRRWEQASLAGCMWGEIAGRFEQRLAALQAVQTTQERAA